MVEECLFCRIISREILSDVVYQDDEFLAFKDIHPQAPTHVLIIPKVHFDSLVEISDQQEKLMGRLVIIAKKLAEKEGLAKKGYRLVLNCGAEGGQVVPHLHLHLIGGRKLNGKIG
jgi:histidine triad (HIT) family protein